MYEIGKYYLVSVENRRHYGICVKATPYDFTISKTVVFSDDHLYGIPEKGYSYTFGRASIKYSTEITEEEYLYRFN